MTALEQLARRLEAGDADAARPLLRAALRTARDDLVICATNALIETTPPRGLVELGERLVDHDFAGLARRVALRLLRPSEDHDARVVLIDAYGARDQVSRHNLTARAESALDAVDASAIEMVAPFDCPLCWGPESGKMLGVACARRALPVYDAFRPNDERTGRILDFLEGRDDPEGAGLLEIHTMAEGIWDTQQGETWIGLGLRALLQNELSTALQFFCDVVVAGATRSLDDTIDDAGRQIATPADPLVQEIVERSSSNGESDVATTDEGSRSERIRQSVREAVTRRERRWQRAAFVDMLFLGADAVRA